MRRTSDHFQQRGVLQNACPARPTNVQDIKNKERVTNCPSEGEPKETGKSQTVQKGKGYGFFFFQVSTEQIFSKQ